MSGSNSEHVEFFCVDEIDVIPRQNVPAYYQAQNIPDPRDGMLPLMLLTSTRKSRTGLVQKEIDDSAQTGLQVLHWNLIDTTQACEPARHDPTQPKQTYYVNDDDLKHVLPQEYEILNPGQQTKWYPLEGFAGCQRCRLFPACKGRLATHQTSTSPMLKPIDFSVGKFQSAPSADFISTEYLCFTGDAQVMMSDGTTKPIAAVQKGDFVITHLGNVAQVTNTMERHYEGDLVVINPGTRNKHWGTIRSTPEHPFFVDGAFKESKDLTTWKFDKWGGLKSKGDYLSFPAAFTSTVKSIDLIYYAANPSAIELNPDGTLESSISSKATQIPNTLELNYNFGWIVGYFLAEGSIITNQNGTHKNIAFSSDRRETDFHQKVRDFFGSVYEHDTASDHGYVQNVSSCLWSNVFEGMCGRYSDLKQIHQSLMQGPLDFQRGVLEGFNAGDGTKDIVGGCELTTTSGQLASQLSLIAGRLGFCPRIQKLKKGPNKQAYRVYCSDPSYVYKQKRTKFALKDGYNQYRLDSKTSEKFAGTVYNIEVEGDNSYIVNGVAVHNCRKPDSSGLVYPKLNKEIHLKTPSQMASLLTGEPFPGDMSKWELIKLIKTLDATFFAGMDWGFTHPFAVVTMVRFAQYVFVLDAYLQAGLELEEQVSHSEFLKKVYNNPQIWADPASPGSIKTLQTKGFKARMWEKRPFSVKAGIEIVRSLLWNARGVNRMYFLKGDPGVELLFKHMENYKFRTDMTGRPTEEPDETDDDGPDAVRYAAMNEMGRAGAIKDTSLDSVKTDNSLPAGQSDQPGNYLKDFIRKEIASAPEGTDTPSISVKRGRLTFTQ
jgi:intein/homing endonuclease